jgi:hypothetical protein
VDGITCRRGQLEEIEDEIGDMRGCKRNTPVLNSRRKKAESITSRMTIL